MASTFSGRYNNESNSTIAMNAVNGNTSIGNDLNSYRGKSGIKSSGAVSFSDLRGVYNTSASTNQYLVPGQSSSVSTFQDYFTYASYKSTSYGNGYYTSWYVSGYQSPYGHVPYTSLGYYYNADTGGYNWGFLYTNRSSYDYGNPVIAAIFNKKHHIFIGDMANSVESAIAMGFIGNKYIDINSNATTSGIGNVNPFNLFVGQRYQSSVDVGNENSLFRTTSRSYMKAAWITGGALYIGTLYTSPFSSGAALSAYSSSQMLTSSTGRHKNNTVGFGWAQHYDHGQPTNYKPLLQWYDIGLRNAKNKATFTNAVTDADAVDGTTAVLPFNT